jgi:hypothetical protein
MALCWCNLKEQHYITIGAVSYFFLIPVFFLLSLSFTVHPLRVFIVFDKIHKTLLQYGAMLVLSQRTTIIPIAIYCCLLLFSYSSILFVTVIIYRSSPFGFSLYCQHSQKKNCIMSYCWCYQKAPRHTTIGAEC